MLESQLGEKVSDKMKIAIMTSMLPPVIQDFVYQNVTRDMLFENLLEKIGVWVGNRVAMNEGVTPMDIEVQSVRLRTGLPEQRQR